MGFLVSVVAKICFLIYLFIFHAGNSYISFADADSYMFTGGILEFGVSDDI